MPDPAKQCLTYLQHAAARWEAEARLSLSEAERAALIATASADLAAQALVRAHGDSETPEGLRDRFAALGIALSRRLHHWYRRCDELARDTSPAPVCCAGPRSGRPGEARS